MFGEKFGHVFDRPLTPLARKIPFDPNTLSITGFLITVLASCTLISDLRIGGVLVLVGGLFDILDGVVARAHNKASKFGAFLDSVLDRYADAFILLAIAWNLGTKKNLSGVLLCLGILIGAFLVSYTRARAEGLGEDCKHGLMERPERIVLIAFATISGFVMPVLWLMIVLTHYTVFQRIYQVWRLTAAKKV
jgi:phosphatidylglycerophosphate synthase